MPDKNGTLTALMIGPLPPPIGGISVSFELLVNVLLLKNSLHIDIVDFNAIRRQRGTSLSSLIDLCRILMMKTRRVDVVTVYFASTALPTLGLLSLVISRLFNKPYIVRKAAGFDYMDLGPVQRHIAHFVIQHADLYLAQTKYLVSLAQNRGITHVKWFPSSRPAGLATQPLPKRHESCRRFVFVSQVRDCKGINEIIDAAERFGEQIHVDIYGPFFDDIPETVFDHCRRITYCGTLRPEDVIPTLRNYDMLLLPTKAKTEGYPGAIIEGYAAGLPVITTTCGGIPEIVDSTSGIFVEAGNAESLFAGMKSIIEDNGKYHNLFKGACEKQKEFDLTIWADRFIEYCNEVYLNRYTSKRSKG
jgi:glycosyltransferase involved in cell wall biosynthesis